MLGELAYWMHYYLVKLVRVKKEKTGIFDSLFLLSIVMFVNILTIITLVELAGWHELTDWWNYFSGSVEWSKSNTMAWVYAAFLISPLLWINWRLFFLPEKFKVIRERCEKMGRKRRVIGQWLFWFYIVGSQVAFMAAIKQKFSSGDKEYRDSLEEIRELKSPSDGTGEKIMN